jgi:hypothetical protein
MSADPLAPALDLAAVAATLRLSTHAYGRMLARVARFPSRGHATWWAAVRIACGIAGAVDARDRVRVHADGWTFVVGTRPDGGWSLITVFVEGRS